MDAKEILKQAIEEINEQLEENEKVKFSPDIHFIGSQACMDSITFVTFISTIEELIEDKLGKTVRLVDEKAFSQKRSPFYSIETMTAYIDQLIKETK